MSQPCATLHEYIYRIDFEFLCYREPGQGKGEGWISVVLLPDVIKMHPSSPTSLSYANNFTAICCFQSATQFVLKVQEQNCSYISYRGPKCSLRESSILLSKALNNALYNIFHVVTHCSRQHDEYFNMVRS